MLPNCPQISSGIEPGVAVSIKSSNECVYTTLAFSALHSILAAYSGGWAGAAGGILCCSNVTRQLKLIR